MNDTNAIFKQFIKDNNLDDDKLILIRVDKSGSMEVNNHNITIPDGVFILEAMKYDLLEKTRAVR